MTLKQQIEATIQAYEEACKPENLNFWNCYHNELHFGICYFIDNKYIDLHKHILNQDFWLICQTPLDLIVNTNYNLNRYKGRNMLVLLENPTILDCHQTRLQYLRNLLNTLPNDSDN